MRSVTPFCVVGLKTTGDCWHCWKATRSTIYFFAFIFLLPPLSLFFLLALFSFLLSSSLADRMLFQFFQVLVSNTRVFFLRFVRGIDECGGRIIKKQYASFESVVNFLSFWKIRDTVLRIVNRGRGEWKIRFIREWNLSLLNVSLYALAMRSDTILSSVIYDVPSCPSKWDRFQRFLLSFFLQFRITVPPGVTYSIANIKS